MSHPSLSKFFLHAAVSKKVFTYKKRRKLERRKKMGDTCVLPWPNPLTTYHCHHFWMCSTHSLGQPWSTLAGTLFDKILGGVPASQGLEIQKKGHFEALAKTTLKRRKRKEVDGEANGYIPSEYYLSTKVRITHILESPPNMFQIVVYIMLYLA